MSLVRTRMAVALLTLTGLVLVGLQAPALAAPSPKPSSSQCPNPGGKYPPGQCGGGAQPCKGGPTVTIGDNSPTPGTKTHVHGECFRPNSEVKIYVDGRLLGTYRTDALGNVDEDVLIPLDLRVGSHSLVLRGTGVFGSAVSAATRFRILAPVSAGGTTGSSGFPLPRTGAEAALVSALGLLLLSLGTTLVVAARRRSRSTNELPA